VIAKDNNFFLVVVAHETTMHNTVTQFAILSTDLASIIFRLIMVIEVFQKIINTNILKTN
jgi:hypothetical protein